MPSYYKGTRDIKKEHYNMGVLLTEEAKIEILKENFERRVGYELNLDKPKSFNEKIMWSKLYYQNPLITKCCDKFAVKDYVNEVIGEGHIVPNIASWDSPDDIDFDALPDQFVLKVNWSSGYNIICHDKSKLDQEKTRRQLKKWMTPDRNAYYQFFNWGYKHMKPVVYAEEYIEQAEKQVYDYKFFVFNGKVKMMFIATDRFNGMGLTHDFFDEDFNHLPFTYGGLSHAETLPEKPKHYDRMVEYAEKLAKPFPFSRVDFYEIEDQVLLGEMTFYPGGGILPFDPEEWDYKIGEWLTLPEKTIADKPSALLPVKVAIVKGYRTFKRGLKSFRQKIIKHSRVKKGAKIRHDILLFGKFRIPFYKYRNFYKFEGMEIKRKSSAPPVKKTVNQIPAFEFQPTGPKIAYAMEDKITLDIQKHYCEQKGYKQLKYFPNLTNPRTFNEKLLWLAIYYKNPNYSIACDKARGKDWVGERVGYEYVVPSYGIYEDPNDIDLESLPDQFVMKANNGWGANEIAIVRDKSKCNADQLKALASTWLYPWRFYYYQNMCITDEKPEKPLIVIEKLLEEEGKKYLNDYKLYCCNGKVKFSMIVTDRGSSQQARTFVDTDWKVMPVRRAGKFSNSAPEKPINYDKMVELAETLSKDMPFVRIDFYEIEGEVYVGEMTFTPGLFLRFNPSGADEYLGQYLDISDVMKEVNAKSR